MEDEVINENIRKKIKTLMEEMGIKKIRIGEALGDFVSGEAKQKTFLRAQRFLNGPSPIKIQALAKVARLLQKPLVFFLPEGNETLFQLETSDQCRKQKSSEEETQKSLNEIKKNLEKLGFSNEFVTAQMKFLESEK